MIHSLLCTRLRRPLHPNIPILNLPQVLQHKAALEIRVRMQDSIEFRGWPEGFILHLIEEK